ncbi:SusD/RagB family nutrient-binding outer membrane lipoprotein [Pontibacter silvestris]|uniref:SusD/RagB family nutrient-binding outer membrane lipoprotein n=1 Tax=Pontibacter silvestris TaxID=2305183 RepID=A0ABW4WUW3_9BACT|nr:SusD/RagB family nutrient-binding outer membrane lipoprotein [Pontibacter silvestris]MCC9136382.1 SusD/RagB family nutrient-binding outer membrane lipoprotein [Pontibacter silvestris]
MKKLLIFFILTFSIAACTDDFEEDLIDPRSPVEVPATGLFSNAQRNLVDQMTTPSVNSGIFRLLAQQWASTDYPRESQYDIVTRNIPQNFWNELYTDVLMDLREARTIVTADETFPDPAEKANQIAMIEIMEVYTWSVLVNTFGDIPYNEALNPENVQPTYDDAAEIYADLFTRLDAALNSLNESAGSGDFAAADLIYGGDIESWIMFGNSLKLRMGMTLADVDETTARRVVAEAADNVFTSLADNADFQYTETTPNVNPIWTNLVQSGRNDFVPANTLVDVMNELDDPRRSEYFTLFSNGEYVGGTYGTGNPYSNFSHVNPAITAPDFEAVLLSYDEVEFYLAEAAARGFDVSGTAGEHYTNAIRASMEYWGVPEAEINAYLSQPEVAWTGGGNWRQQIGVQKWIALYNRGFEAWTEYRRLDYPQLEAPAVAEFDVVPVRYPYPAAERTLNTANVPAGDEATNRIFWDVQ